MRNAKFLPLPFAFAFKNLCGDINFLLKSIRESNSAKQSAADCQSRNFGRTFFQIPQKSDPNFNRLAKLCDVAVVQNGRATGVFFNHPDLVRDLLVVNAHNIRQGVALCSALKDCSAKDYSRARRNFICANAE